MTLEEKKEESQPQRNIDQEKFCQDQKEIVGPSERRRNPAGQLALQPPVSTENK
jgi:hypothetical protein